jgi:DNA-binding transcriptional ArsR family regulator
MTAVVDSVIPDEVLDEVARRFSLLGDPTRLRVVRALHDVGECSVREVSELAGTTVANASQHLARLHEGGVVSRRRVGKSVRYLIVDPTIEALCRTVCDRVRDRASSPGLTAPSAR